MIGVNFDRGNIQFVLLKACVDSDCKTTDWPLKTLPMTWEPPPSQGNRIYDLLPMVRVIFWGWHLPSPPAWFYNYGKWNALFNKGINTSPEALNTFASPYMQPTAPAALGGGDAPHHAQKELDQGPQPQTENPHLQQNIPLQVHPPSPQPRSLTQWHPPARKGATPTLAPAGTARHTHGQANTTII